MVFIKKISKIVILTFLLLVSVGVDSFAQSKDIHQNLCKGGSRVVTFQSTSKYYRWYVINRTTGVTDIYNINNHEYTFVMPDANEVYEVYVEYRDKNSGPWTKSSNSVIMYPYDFPDAIINPAGTVEFSGSITLDGSISGALPSSNFPITIALDLNYEWVYNGASVETGDGSTDSYSASNGGDYVYRVFDSNQKVSGCTSTSPITELTESLVFNVPVCEGGFITGEMLMDIGLVPEGHRDGGTWDETGGLIFSDFGRSPIITGYLSGNSYLIKWYKNPAKTYSFNLVAGSGYSFELQNESGTTSDVILCTGTHTFSVNPAGDTHTFMVNNLTDGTTTELASGVSNSYAFSSPNPNAIYEVYAIVEKNGCYFETNPIKVSSDKDVEIKVVGDESVCSGDFNIVLEAIPYDPAYTYTWERNGVDISGGQFLNVLPYGNGEYIVRVIGCGGVEYESKPVTVNNYVLPDARINPTGTLLACAGDSPSLNGYMDGIHPTGANMTYEWLYNGAGGLASGAGVTSSISVSNIGDYEYKLYETDNPLCYSVSPPTSLVSIDLSFNSFIANGSTTFCGSTIASASLEASLAGTTGQISVTITNTTDGSSQLVLLNTGESKNVSFGILSTTNTYKVTAVSAAGCSLTPTQIDAIPEITFTRGNDPIVFNLTGSDYCGNGVIGLDGSEVGVDYYLYLNNVFVAGSTQLGTGLPISFGNQSVEGVYTIKGEVVSCENLTDMNGQLTIYRKPLLDLNVSIAGSGCAGSAHAITVSNTEVGISYRLYRGTTAVSSIQPGTGGDMVFSGIVTAGSYTVMALNGACQETLDNSVFIAPTPLLQNLLETVGCEGVDFFVELAGSEIDVEYRVTNSGGSILETILGDGGPLAFTTPLVSADVYTVTAINGYGCSRNIGTVTLLTQPVTTYILSTPVSPACSGTDHVLTLSGSQIGVTYRLYRNNTTGTPLTSVVGTGLVVSFGPQSVAGTYIVTANNAGCEVVLPSELVMYQQPNVYSIVGGTYCEDDDVIITLNNSQSSVTYYLYRDGVDYGSDQTGITGAPITFGPEKYPPGTYTIRGSSGGCFANMAGLVTVNSNPIINIPNLSSSYCADAGNVTISGSPANANGSWSVVGYSPLPNNFTDNGNGTLSFDVGNVLNNYGQRSFIIGYSYVDPNGCNSFIERTTLFQDDLGDVIRFEGLPAVTCQGATAFNLQAYLNYSTRINITTNDGVFSGAGITDNANGTGTFDPDVAGNGVHNITYSYTDPNTGCNGSYSISVQVGTTLTIEGLDPIYCVEDDGVKQWYGTPEGETLIIYKVDGVGNRTLLTQKANVSQLDPLEFTPSVSGSGDYIAVYSFVDGSGCVNEIEESFVVEDELDTSFDTSTGATQFCENGSSVSLVSLQPGGYYSGAGVSGNTFSPSVAGEGNHIVTYTINTGACNSSTDITLTVIKVPDLSIDFIQDEYCENAAGPIKLEANNDGIINAIYTFSSTLNVAGRSPIYVSTPGDSDGVDIVDDQFYFDPAYVGEGTYHITYTFDNSANSGCTAVYTKTVHVLNAPEVNFGGIADPIEYCHDGSLVELTGSFVSGGLTGSGNFSGSGIINGTLDDGVAEFDPSMVIPGDYSVTYTYTHVSGCVTSREKTFSVNESPIVYNITPYSTIPNSSKYCEGDAGVTIGVDFSQTGITYELIYNNNIAAPVQTMPGDGNAIEFAVPVKLTGTYTVRAITALGCYSMMNGSVQVMMNKVSAAILSENVSCNAGNDGAITVTASGGSIAYVYQISTDAITFSSQASNVFSGLVAGNYYIQVTDQIGCEMPAAIPVVINQPSTPLDVTSTTVDVGCLPCIDGGNCDGLATLIITGGSPFADLTTYPSGYSITWTDASSAVIGNGLSINNKQPGTYTATVTDAAGCIVNHVVEIFHLQPVLTLDEVLSQHINVDCNGAATGVFGVIATGGSGSYEFSLDGVSWFSNGSNTYSFTGLTVNTYQPYVRDAAYPRCEKLSDPVVIDEPDALMLMEVVASHIDVDCFAESTGQVEVVATGGSGDYEYSIDNGANWQLSPTFSGLASGTFYIWVRDLNAKTCIYKSVVVTIQQPTQLSLIPNIINHVTCFGGNNGSISVTAAGGSGNYSFSINGGASWQTDALFQNLTEGSYQISLRDESSVGCELLNGVSATINQPQDFTISESIAAHKDVSCFGGNNGSFTILPSRTGNFQYSVDGLIWQVSPVFTNLVAGGYQVSVRDMGTAAPTYCVKNNFINVVIDQPGASLSVVIDNIINVSCLGGSNGSIQVTTENGTAPYNYQWYRVTGSGNVPLGAANNGNTNMATNLIEGDYLVMVTDDHGCQANDTYSIIQPTTEAVITVDVIDHITIVGGNDGAIEISVSDGSIPYSSIIWSGIDMGGVPITGLTDGIYRQENLIAGVYEVSVTDANNCVTTRGNIVVSQPGMNLGFIITKTNPQPCNGLSNGTINLSVVGGMQPYQSIVLTNSALFEYPKNTFGNNYANYIDLPAGNYTATVLDLNGISYSVTIVLTEPDAINFTFVKVKDVTCSGETNGTVQLSITGGTAYPGNIADPLIPDNPYYNVLIIPSVGATRSYLVEENISFVVNDLSEDSDYKVLVEDANACSASELFAISQPDPLSVTGGVKNVSCHGQADGEILVSILGRGAGTPFTYNWERFDGGIWITHLLNGNALLSGLPVGSYRVKAIEMATGCEVTSAAYDISEPTDLLVDVEAFDVITCKGDNSGRIVITVSGGVAPYEVSYGVATVTNNGPVFNLTSLPAGPYSITVKDNNGIGCGKTVSTIINEPLQSLTVSDINANINCETINTGIVSFNIEGGVSNAANEFSYTVSLLNTLTGTNYGLVVAPTLVQPFTVSINTLPAGEYLLTVTDGIGLPSASCPVYTRNISLQHIDISADVINATCSGINTGEIKNIVVVGGSGNYVWNWSSPSGGLGLNNANLNQTGLSAGTYVLELNDLDRGCTVTKTYYVLFGNDIQVAGSTKAVTCAGKSDGAIYNINVSGVSDPDLTFVWSGPDIGIITVDPINPNLTDLAGGTYTLSVTDGNGCVVIETFTVEVPLPIQFDLTTSLDNCDPYSRSVTMNNLNGGTGNLSFVWNGPGSFSNTGQNLTGLILGGTYNVTVFDENMCMVNQDITIPGVINVDATIQNLTCNGENNGGVVLHVTGGSGDYSYVWSTTDGSGISANIKDQENLTAGTYTVVVTDNVEMVGGTHCLVTKSFILTQPTEIKVTGNKTDVLCAGNNNGTITLDVVGGSGSYTYNWSSVNGTGLVQGVKDQTGLSGGTYSVIVQDANGCNAIADFTINEPSPLDFTINYDDTDCTGSNRIEITALTGGSGSYQLTWAGPGIPAGFSGTLQENLPGGIYTIRMTDIGVGALCTTEKSVTLTKKLNVTAAISSETCPGEFDGAVILTVKDGEAPYNYNWTSTTGSSVVTGNKNQSGLSSGDYHVQVTDARPCMVELDVTVNNLHTIEVNGGVTNVTCNGALTGAVDLMVSGGSGNYSYLWSSTGFTATSEDITGLAAGSYTVVVTDIDYGGCTVTETYTVTQPALPITVSSVNITPVLCNGSATGEIDITVIGGTQPYTFQWSTTSGSVIVINSEDQTGLIAGSYQVRVTDVFGCFLEVGPYIITEPSLPISINLVDIVNVSIPTQNTGAIEVNVTGGYGNYTYAWEQTAPVTSVIPGSVARQEGLIAGVYRVTVTDENSCTQVLENINITEPGQALNISYISKNVRPCYASNNGEIQLQVVGGTPDMTSGSATYHIVLTRGAVVVADVNDVSLAVSNLEAGFYTVVVTDANGVSESENIQITQPPLMLFNTEVVNDVTCHGGSDAIIRVNVSGGYPATGANYQVRLQGPGVDITRVTDGVNEDFTGLPIGDYTVLVWDDADGDGVYSSANAIEDDCFKSQNIIVTQPEAIGTLSVVSGSEDICEGVFPQLQIIVSGWSNIAANPLEATLNDGTVVIVDDSPFEFIPLTAPATGIFTYTMASLEAQGTSCSKGNGAGSAEVTVHPLPTGRIFGDSRVCEGETAQIAVELTGSSPWSITYTDNTNVWVENNITTALHFITVYPAVTSTFELTSVSDVYCNNVGTGMATVEVDELPEVTLSGEADPTICRGESTNLTFTFSKGAGPWIVNWQEIIDVSGTPVVTNRSQTITISPFVLAVKPLVSTTYKLISVTDQNGGDNSCEGVVGSQDVVVTVNQYPSQPSSIIGPAEVCQGATETYSVPATNYAVGYVWDLPIGASIVNGSGTRTIEVYFDEAISTSGYLRVRGTNSCGEGLSREIYLNINLLPVAIGPINGPEELCQGTTNAAYSVDAIADATGYTWAVPAGLTIQGQGTASIFVDIDPNIDSFTGQITVNPHNSCGNSLATAILDVTVYPLPVANAGLDENICADTYELSATALPVEWTGHWEVVAGLGSANIVNPNSVTTNVTNISRGDVTFRWTVTHTHASAACSVYDEVIIRNNNLAVNATAVESLVCDGEAEINGTPVPNGYDNTSGLWEAIEPVGSAASFDASTTPNTMVRNLEPGLNRLRWSLIQNGCPSYAVIEIMNNKPDQAIIYGLPEVDLCVDVVSLTANNPIEGNGKWSIIQGFGSFSSLTNENVTVSNIAKGTNIFRWTISKGSCSSYADVVVRNNQLDVSAGDVQLICTDNTVLEGTEPPLGTTGQWTVELGGAVAFTDGTLYNTAVSNLGYDDNILRWTITKNGCKSSAIVTITSDRPTTALVGSMQTICGDETTLTGNDALQGNGRWSVISGSGVFDDPDDSKTSVSGIGFGDNVFRWTITKNDCSSSADLTIRNLKVYVYAGKDTVICERVTQLHANTPTVGTGQWHMIAGMGGATFLPGNNILPNATVGGLDYGENGFVWTITNNTCVSRDSVVIVNNGPYPVEAGPDFITNGPVATLNATTPTIGDGHWELISGGGNVVNPTSAVSQITELRRGENVFRWTVTHLNCSEYDEVTITNGETIESNAGRDQVVCANSATLEGNDPDVAIGKWSIVEGSGIFDDVYNPNTGVTNLGFGDNIFRWTIYYSSSNSSDDVLIKNNMPDQANAGNFDAVCGSEYQLSGNPVRLDMGIGFWTLFSGGGTIGDPTLPNPNVTGLGYGENKFIYTITNGDPGEQCVSTDTVIIINGLPTDALAGNNDTICVDYANLKPNTPIYGVGEWYVGNIGSARFEGGWARDLASGPNMLIWKISTDYCSSLDTIIIVNNSPSVADAGQSRDICETIVTLSANAPIHGIGSWELLYGSGVIQTPLNDQTIVTGLAKGENTFQWTIDNNGCKSVSSVVIRNNMIEANAGGSQTLCADNTILEANNPLPGVGTWGLLGGSGSANFDDLNDPYTKVSNLDQGENVLTWTINYKGCESVSLVTITNNNPTTSYAGLNDATCEPSYVLAGNLPEVYTSASWTIREGGGEFSNINDPNARVDNLKFGTNIYRWTIQNQNCTSFSDVKIEFNRIVASAGGDRPICAAETVLEGNSALPGVGVWSVPGGQGTTEFVNSSNPSTTVSNLRKGKNLLRWTISYKGCSTFDDVEITNNMPSDAYAGNNQVLCDSITTLDATVVEIGTGRWSIGSGYADFENDLSPKTRVTGLSKGENLLIWTVTNESCVLQDQVLITNNKPSKPYAGSDYQEICENNFSLKAAIPEYGTGQWTFLKGGGTLSDYTDPRAVITMLNHGTNQLRWTVTAGQCTLSDEIIIENNTPTKANAGPDVEDCKDWRILDANKADYGVGLWERVSGNGDLVDPSDPKTRVENLEFGPNIFRWNIQNGNCISSDEVVIFNKIPDKANAGGDQTICEDYTVLNSNEPLTGVGSWSVIKGQGTFTNPSAYNTTVTNVGFGENIYQWQINYGECVTIDEVIVLSNKAFANAGEDQVVYESTAILNSNNAGELNAGWSVVGTSSAEFENSAFFNTRVNNLSTGVNTFKWSIDVDGCIAFNLVSVDYRPVPDAGFIVNTEEGCYPLTVRFTNYSVGGTVYYWDFGDGNTSGDSNPVHIFENPGVFTVSLSSPGPDGHDGIATKNISVFDHPTSGFTVNPELVYIPEDYARFYDLSNDAISWHWKFGDGNESALRNPSHKYQDAGIYDVMLTVSNQHGCEDSVTIEGAVVAELSGFITFPSAFKPRPGVSETGTDPGMEYSVVFKPVYRDVDTYLIQIFNRWGQLIFQSTDIDAGWDGMYEGQLAPQAVYVYKASGKYLNGRGYSETGSVLLVR